MESQGDVNAASSPVDAQPLRRRTQEVDCGENHRWAAVYQSVARRMLSYLENSKALKVDTKELEDHVLAPNEPRVDIDHTARQARGEQPPDRFMSRSLGSVRLSQRRPSGKEQMSARCGLTRWAPCGPSSTQSTLNLRGGDRRWLMQTGTPSAKQSTEELRETNGNSCIVTTEI